jgi:hypothetical protein
MVRDFPLLLPRGVTVAQVTLDHFVMVRIHARQPLAYEAFTRFALNPNFGRLDTFEDRLPRSVSQHRPGAGAAV